MSPAEFFYRIGNILSDLKHNKLTKYYLELKFHVRASRDQNRLLTKHYLCWRDETWSNVKFFRIKNAIEITCCDYSSRYLRVIHLKKKRRKKNISVKNDKFFKKSKYCIGSIIFNDRIFIKHWKHRFSTMHWLILKNFRCTVMLDAYNGKRLSKHRAKAY